MSDLMQVNGVEVGDVPAIDNWPSLSRLLPRKLVDTGEVRVFATPPMARQAQNNRRTRSHRRTEKVECWMLIHRSTLEFVRAFLPRSPPGFRPSFVARSTQTRSESFRRVHSDRGKCGLKERTKLLRTVPGAGDRHQRSREERGGQIATPLGSDTHPPHLRLVYSCPIHLSPEFLFFPVPNLTNNIIRIRGFPPTYKVPVKLVTEPLVASPTRPLSSTLPATNFNPPLQTVSSVHIAVKVSRRTLEVFP